MANLSSTPATRLWRILLARLQLTVANLTSTPATRLWRILLTHLQLGYGESY
jgi:hypothetical protein